MKIVKIVFQMLWLSKMIHAYYKKQYILTTENLPNSENQKAAEVFQIPPPMHNCSYFDIDVQFFLLLAPFTILFKHIKQGRLVHESQVLNSAYKVKIAKTQNFLENSGTTLNANIPSSIKSSAGRGSSRVGTDPSVWLSTGQSSWLTCVDYIIRSDRLNIRTTLTMARCSCSMRLREKQAFSHFLLTRGELLCPEVSFLNN